MNQHDVHLTRKKKAMILGFGLIVLISLIIMAINFGLSFYQKENTKNLEDTVITKELDRLNSNLQIWTEADIDSYEIVVEYGHWVTHYEITIMVKNGEITQSTQDCYDRSTDTPCEHTLNPIEYTVEGLFNHLSNIHESPDDYWNPKYADVTFSTEYGFPTEIWYNHSDWEDDGYCIIVVSFTVIE